MSSVITLRKKWDKGEGYVTLSFIPLINKSFQVNVTSDPNNSRESRSMVIKFIDTISGKELNSITVSQREWHPCYSRDYSSDYHRKKL